MTEILAQASRGAAAKGSHRRSAAFGSGLAVAMALMPLLGEAASEPTPVQGTAAVQGGLVEVPLGHSEVVRPGGVPGTIIVGDDAIAVATLGAGNSIILSGRSVGLTNLIVLDADGGVMMSRQVAVAPAYQEPRAGVGVMKAGDRTQYECRRSSGCAPSGTDRGSEELMSMFEAIGGAIGSGLTVSTTTATTGQ